MKTGTCGTRARRASRRRLLRPALTLIEVIAVGVILTVIFSVVLLSLWRAKERAREDQWMRGSHRQQRGIHQMMVVFASSDSGHMPGLTFQGNIIDDGPATGSSGDGATAAARYWILLNGNYFTGDLTIHPAESSYKTRWTTGPVTALNYSYAMLALDGPGRLGEWRDNANAKAAMLSDCHVGSAADEKIRTVWDGGAGVWRGFAVWGDNHASYYLSHRPRNPLRRQDEPRRQPLRRRPQQPRRRERAGDDAGVQRADGVRVMARRLEAAAAGGASRRVAGVPLQRAPHDRRPARGDTPRL